MRRITSAAILLGVCCLGQSAFAEESKPPAEMKVWERFVGTWDCDVVSRAARWWPKETRTRAVEINEMSLDGWFLHGVSKTPDGKTVAVLMNTYDPRTRKYRIWRFVGRTCEELTGEWDEKSSTLTITTLLENEITNTATFHIIDADHREFHVVAKDSAGNIYADLQGTVTRRSK